MARVARSDAWWKQFQDYSGVTWGDVNGRWIRAQNRNAIWINRCPNINVGFIMYLPERVKLLRHNENGTYDEIVLMGEEL